MNILSRFKLRTKLGLLIITRLLLGPLLLAGSAIAA
jgi:hypothetical protein